MVHPVFSVRHVSKEFGRQKVLVDININITDGEIFGIIGPSGSGKTTLLHTLIGFIEPTRGEVLFRHTVEGKSVLTNVISHESQFKHMVGFAAQEASFYGNLTIEENLDLFASLYGLSHSAKRKNIDILLGLMGLVEHKHHLAKNISGGMRKRLDLACSLIHDPSILIMDEPTADLDPYLRWQMWQLIKKINNKGTTIILSSHFLDELETVCDRVGIMWEGSMKHLGTPAQLKHGTTTHQVVYVETLKGDYSHLVASCNSLIPHPISKIEHKGNHLLIYTSDAHRIITMILGVIEAIDDILVNMHIEKATLTSVFEHLSKQHEKVIHNDIFRRQRA